MRAVRIGSRRFSTQVPELRKLVFNLERSNPPPGELVYIDLLIRCGESNAAAEGRRVFSHYTSGTARRTGSSTRIQNRYISMLGKCDLAEEARLEFDRIENKDAFSWNIMIKAYAQTGHNIEALELLWMMDLEGKKPSYITFISVLRACSCDELLGHGIGVYNRAVAEGLQDQVWLATAAQSMFGRCGMVDEARNLFENLECRDLIAWNSIISAYAQHGHPDEVLLTFRRMVLEGERASKAALINVLDSCSRTKKLELGRSIHRCVLELGLDQDVMIATSLVSMFGKCGSFRDAMIVFGNLSMPDLVAWNAMIQACSEQNRFREGIRIFAAMDLEGFPPNESSFMSVIGACSSPAAAAAAPLQREAVHRLVEESGSFSDVVKGALINMYIKCGKLDRARVVFEQQGFKDLISTTSMIVGYAQIGDDDQAMAMFRKLDLEGIKPDRVTFLGALDGCSNLTEAKQLHARILESGRVSEMQASALICMYAKCGSFDDSRRVFEEISANSNTSVWTAMAATCSQHGRHIEAVELFRKMDLEGLRANEITFVSIIDACSAGSELEQGRLIHRRVLSSGFSAIESIGNSVINMYARCGSLTEARAEFEAMPVKNTVTWSTLVGGYTHHGRIEESLQLFFRMQLDGFEPDDPIFVSILSACSHAGLVETSRSFFVSIAGDYGFAFASEHFGCILDVLGRAGRLDEAEELISVMPFEPSGGQRLSLLCACKIHNDIDRALRIAIRISSLAPEKKTEACMLLSNTFAAWGLWPEAETVRAIGLAARTGTGIDTTIEAEFLDEGIYNL